ncbi:ABC transporter permease [Emticicia sp. BO119]|uniref:ABC transporter permease n=1 Tax=Emticicia sp. BO119 TaxID=2757768 RepID=UPI0015F0D36F|nr:ABC transporter permease [Emticicia sp. BO119]MBA4850892.1 ABC transporter permease [Emticicia sp. BO119]
MIRNYLKIAWRNLLKNKLQTLINITGLSIGMSSCILILMFVFDEMSYDKSWENGDRIYRMALERIYPGRATKYAIIPPSYAQSVRKELPEVEESVRIFDNGGGTLVRHNNQVYEKNHVLFADSNFFKVFKLPLLFGNPDKALLAPNTIVLTESTAKRFFGTTNAMGKYLELVQGPKLQVTGICADVPKNSHFQFDFLGSVKGNRFAEATNHISFAASTYLLLKPHTSPEQVQAKFPSIVEKYAAGEVQRNFGVSFKDYLKAGNGYFYFLQPLQNIHLESHLEAELGANGSKNLVYIFMVIAVFVLLIACINFMNLATARSTERAKEVGIRKTLGSTKSQLSIQFLTESVLLSVASLFVAILIVVLVLPFFNNLANKTLILDNFFTLKTIPLMLILSIAVGLMAGVYPAGVLSSFQPIQVLKGKFTSKKQGHALRNGLVVFQFSISIILIISTLIVYRQLNYIQNKELGYSKDFVIHLRGAGFLGDRTQVFKDEIQKIAGVEKVGGTSAEPGQENFFGISFRKGGEKETVTGKAMIADEGYLQTLNMETAEGRFFNKEFNDSLSIILNQEAVKALGLKNPIGQKIFSPDNFVQGDGPEVSYTIVGVVKDFHFSSLHQKITPLFIVNNRFFARTSNLIGVRINTPDFESVVSQLQKTWKKFLPEQPFNYAFLDADLAELYRNEKVSQQVFWIFSCLGILIACMGLLGLVSYIVQQRTKEIGIRKVLGATVPSIILLLSKDLLKLVLIALLVASPIAYYFMNSWLQDFAYKTEINWWVFVLAGVMAIIIAFVTISFQSIKAALMNPVKSLKTE